MTEHDTGLMHDQVAAIEQGALVRAMPELGTIVVTGPDRQTWLAGLLTADIKSMKAGDARYALSVNKNGKLQMECYVVVQPERVLLAAHRDLIAGVVEQMDHFLIMEDAEIGLLDEPLSWWLVHGPAVDAVAAAAEEAGAIIGAGHLGDTPTLAVALAPGAHPSPTELLTKPDGVLLATPKGWDRVRIERLWPMFGVDFEVGCYPQEASLEGLAVSFNKGCYLGQEAVFMLEKRGNPSKRLVRFQLEGAAPATGDAITTAEGAEVGVVTSTVQDAGTAWVLGRVRHKHTQAGTELRVGDRLAVVK